MDRREASALSTGRYARALILVALISAFLVVPADTSFGQTADDVTLTVTPEPGTLPAEGGNVVYTVAISAPNALLPATVDGLTSDLSGAVADAGNPAIVATTCVIPSPFDPVGGSGAITTWSCQFEALVTGGIGVIVDTISATLTLSDATTITQSATAEVTVTAVGALHGRLIDADTSEPIAGVFVWAMCQFCGTMTDGDGLFAFDDIPPGAYWLKSGNENPGGMDTEPPPGYVTPYAMEYYDDDSVGIPEPQAATLVPVVAGQTTTIEWMLSRGGTIAGTVTEAATGRPLSGVHVSYRMVLANGNAQSYGLGFSTTGPDGTYLLQGLRSGPHLVCFGSTEETVECWDDQPPPADFSASGDVLAVELGSSLTGVDAVLGQVPVDPGTGSTPEPAALPFTGVGTTAWAILGMIMVLIGGALVVSRDRRGDSQV